MDRSYLTVDWSTIVPRCITDTETRVLFLMSHGTVVEWYLSPSQLFRRNGFGAMSAWV